MAQPALNDVLTWDGTKGVYAPNPGSAPSLTDTYIFVGNSIGVATGVPLTLNDTPGPFSLSNTGLLTMPDASSTSRGLLNATGWSTVGYLQNDGAGNLSWQAVSGSQTLAATLAIGNNVGGLAITATDGTASLNLTTGSAIVYSNVSSGSAPRLTLDQGTALARMSSVHGTVDFDATAMNLTHSALINFSALQYSITNIATDSYLYVDASGFIVAGTAPIVTVPTLYQVLSAGASMGGASMTSPDTLSTLDITNSLIQLNWTNSTAQGQLYFNATNIGLAWSDGTQSAAFNANATEGELIHSQDLTVNAPILRLGTRTDNTSIIYGYNSTTHTFVSATASTVPYFDASKNLVSSAITPTELGYLTGATSALQAQIDAIVSGLSWKQAVRVRTTANITLSGTQTIDGIAVIANDRVLVMNQTAPTENGIYVCSAGAWSRSTDADTGAELLSATVATQEGALYADQQYVCTTDAPITIGVSNIVFVLVGGTTYVGTTDRITVTGNTIDIAGTYIGQTSITTLGTITSGTWNGTAINYAYIASMTSAQLAGIISDETGTGALVFGTSPTFTTDITTPIIIGGTGITSNIKFNASTNVGVTSTAVALDFMVGNSAAVNAAAIYHDGQFLIGTTTRNPGSLGILRIGQGTALVDIGESASGLGAIWLSASSGTPTATNYSIRVSNSQLNINSQGSTGDVVMSYLGTTRHTFGARDITLSPGTFSVGVVAGFTFNGAASTLQTAGTESSTVNWNLAAVLQHASNTTITTQRDFKILARTHSFQTATGTITTAATLAISGAPIAGTNAAITNAHALWVQSGQSHFDGNIEMGDAYNFILQTTTGTKIGTATGQKIGFWNATPTIQLTTAVGAATFVANTSAIANDTATFDGYTLGQIVKALRTMGLLA